MSVPRREEGLQTVKLHHNINPDCPSCQKPVYWSKHILVSGRAWHIECFKCSFCQKILEPGQQSYHAGKVFCRDPCFTHLFFRQCALDKETKKCPCGFDKTNQRCLCCDRLINIDSTIYDEFPTSKLPGYMKYTDSKFPRYSSACVRCSKEVYAAEYCYSMNYPWHVSCLRCCLCNRKLTPGNHSVHEGLPFCNVPCYGKVFGIEGYRSLNLKRGP